MSNKILRPKAGTRSRVVVVGGGYAGALAANRLQQSRDIQITVINPRPTFVERIRLHQMVARSGHATLDMATVLGDKVRLIVDTAEHIDVAGRRVMLASGDAEPYDYLVYAVGSTGTVRAAIPGATRFAYPIGELEQAHRLRVALDELPVEAPICVVGGGLTGIEVASELAEQRPLSSVTLLCGGILGPSLSEKARRSVHRQLLDLGVEIYDDAVVAEVDSDSLVLVNRRRIRSAVTVWAAGFGVPDLARRSGLTTDQLGRLVTDETMTSIDDVHIIAAGDAAAPSGQPLRMSCQAAMPLGARAADTVLDRLAGSEPTSHGQSFIGQNISIGRRLGTIQLCHRDDSPRRVYIVGRFAASIKELACKTVVRQIVAESREPGSYRWPGASRRSTTIKDAAA